MPANGMSRIIATAGRRVAIACAGGCTRARARRSSTRSASVTTASWSGNCSVRVRATHSSPSAGATRRASPRRASDTTLANVASRTSSSQSAVLAPVRVARSRWVANHAISSTVFDRSNVPGLPRSSVISTPPSRPTTMRWVIGTNSFTAWPGSESTSSCRSLHVVGPTHGVELDRLQLAVSLAEDRIDGDEVLVRQAHRREIDR